MANQELGSACYLNPFRLFEKQWRQQQYNGGAASPSKSLINMSGCYLSLLKLTCRPFVLFVENVQ